MIYYKLMSLITNVNDTPQHYFRIEGIQKPLDYRCRYKERKTVEKIDLRIKFFPREVNLSQSRRIS